MIANTKNTPITVHINAPASRHYYILTEGMDNIVSSDPSTSSE